MEKQKKGYWMRQTIKSGSVVERTQFFVGERRPRKDRRKGSTTEKAQENNLNQAVRRLARIINCNFTEKDALVTLTYDDKNLVGVPQTARQLELFRRKLSYHYRKNGIELKSVWITADKDEHSGRWVRVHHHMIMSGLTLKAEDGHTVPYIGSTPLSDLWKNGFVYAEALHEQKDYTPLANYLVRQAVAETDTKKWNTTRNLAKPIIEQEEIVEVPGELKAPPGAKVLEVGSYDCDTGSHYIRYIRKEKRKRAEKTEPPLLPLRKKRPRRSFRQTSHIRRRK